MASNWPQRDNLAWCPVITDRQVAVVVPQAGSAQSATYGNPAPRPGQGGRSGANLPFGRLSFLRVRCLYFAGVGIPSPATCSCGARRANFNWNSLL